MYTTYPLVVMKKQSVVVEHHYSILVISSIYLQSSTYHCLIYQIHMEDVRIEEGDKIGWTVLGDFGPISFDYEYGQRTIFRNLWEESPELGRVYEFDRAELPSIFSIAVDIEEGKTNFSTLKISI